LLYSNSGQWKELGGRELEPVNLVLEKDDKITKLTIRQGAITDGISIESKNKPPVHAGGQGGGPSHFDIPNDEVLVAFSVVYGGVIGRIGW